MAKYEMASVGGVATSQPGGTPQVNISQAQSIQACAAIGNGYGLITNAQWQTIARNLEGVGFNWSNGTVGDPGGMSTGHTDNSPATFLASSTDDNDSCAGTDQTCDLNTWNAQRRVFELSNGSYLWDFGGNVWEWMADTNTSNFEAGAIESTDPGHPADTFISILTDANHPATGTIGGLSGTSLFFFGPAGNYTSLNSGNYGGIGYAWLNYPAGGAILRGGSWDRLLNSGISPFRSPLALPTHLSRSGFAASGPLDECP